MGEPFEFRPTQVRLDLPMLPFVPGFFRAVCWRHKDKLEEIIRWI